ncbi:MAG: glycine--tRNA ligase [Ignavibacteria bacterium]|jgi:glycyl-tRNA synthetase|nr:glycine--tRNA ligase [Ignavibacteria bacterium]
MANNSKNDVMEKIVSLAKRKGFVFQSSEIYGGLNGCYDYGPLGVELLRNIKEAWWKEMTLREDVEGLDASILMHPKTWEASGHVENFTDPMVDCKKCKSRYRVDILAEQISKKNLGKIVKAIAPALYDAAKNNGELKSLLELEDSTSSEDFITSLGKRTDDEKFSMQAINFALVTPGLAASALKEIVCPNCGTKGEFTEARQFNLMFKTFIGPLEESSNAIFIRPETAQGIYLNFLNVRESARQKLPFGIAQVGKAFRNEINTKNFLFRTREFEQMEMQFFVKPGEDEKWFDYWKELRYNWFIKYGLKKEKMKFLSPDKLAHYAKAAADIEYEFPFGWGEIEGIHNRTDFDLKRHTEFSGKKMEYYDEQTKERFIPYVIETSAGASRSFLAFLVDAYEEQELKKENSDGTTSSETRVVLHLHPALAPIKAAIFPLVNRDGMPELAHKITADLRKNFNVFYDESGAVGRRYRRQDENGTPFCITVDTESLENNTVTIRERDSMEQIRIPIDQIRNYLIDKVMI